MQNPPMNVTVFDNGEWGSAVGMAQVEINSSRLLLIRQDRELVPIIIGINNHSIREDWKQFAASSEYENIAKTKSPHGVLQEFLDFRFEKHEGTYKV